MEKSTGQGLYNIGEGIGFAGMRLGVGICAGIAVGLLFGDFSNDADGVTGHDLRLAIIACNPEGFDQRIACFSAIYGTPPNDIGGE